MNIEDSRMRRRYTAGPWECVRRISPSPYDYHIFQKGGGHIVTIFDEGGGNVDRANAALISAAPELLEALEWAVDQIDDSLDPDHRAAVDGCRAAIAKARGIGTI